MAAAEWSWGQWMGAWKAEAGAEDMESERITRMAAAFTGDTIAKMKNINALIVGCRGTGVETAKNLILSNVGSVTVWDPTPATIQDRGANFYLSDADVGKPRATQCLPQLQTLNPYCKVDELKIAESALPSIIDGKTYSAVVVTEMLPQSVLFAMSENARNSKVVFMMAVTSGVTASVFSDFGPKHVIQDKDGEPTEMLAVASAEVVQVGGVLKVSGCNAGDKVLALTLASDHGLDDGDHIVLDDMRGKLEHYNGKKIEVKRLCLCSPPNDMYKLDLTDVANKEILKNSTGKVVETYEKLYENYKEEFIKQGKGDAEAYAKKHSVKTMFNRLVLVLGEGQSLDDWKAYTSGGLANSVKIPIEKSYDSLEKTLVSTTCPQLMDQEVSITGEGCWIQIALATALKFNASKGRWPGLLNAADADEFVALAKGISDERKSIENSCWFQRVDFGFPSGEPREDMSAVEEKLRSYSLLFQTELTGLCAFLGGLIAQEVIKITGKFTPIEQWLHHYDSSILQSKISCADKYKDTRYAHLATIVGEENFESIRKQNIFLVGVGALGCEYAKGIALMGACTSPGSKLIMTDMDAIETSNLSRQFLFRQSDVKSFKSEAAARVVKGWNKDLNVEALTKGVGDNGEDFFDDAFWERVTICWNALDNVLARKYTDRCCLWYGLPLLESGTLGTKTNSEVFLPSLTGSYNDAKEDDTKEAQIAMCTLRSFPYLPLHCIEFAKQAYFSDILEFAPTQYEDFRESKDKFFAQVDNIESPAEQHKILSTVKEFVELQKSGTVTFETCIKKAFDNYVQYFIKEIRDLIYTCDEMEKASGNPFWVGTKRKPKEAAWNAASPPAEGIEYMYACANCYAYMFSVPYVRNRQEFEKQVKAMKLEVPAWSPPGGDVKIDVGEEEGGPKISEEAINNLKMELYAVDTSTIQKMNAHDFEKDDDSNFHVDFLTCGTNMRAFNYDIKSSDRATVKVTAGKIIPALATTTAMVCGLVDNEFLKLAMGLHKMEGGRDKFYCCNINLALGVHAFNAFTPNPPLKLESKLSALPEYNSWDKIVINGEMSLKALVEELEKKYGCKVKELLPAQSGNIVIFDAQDTSKVGWTIELRDGNVVFVEPDAVFSKWPQLRGCQQMLPKLPDGNAKNNFLNQVNAAKKALDAVKNDFVGKYNGTVSDAYQLVARPKEDEKKQAYFDTVNGKRPYIALKAHVTNPEGEDAQLPVIKYIRRK